MQDWCVNFQGALQNSFGRYYMFIIFIFYTPGQLFFAFEITSSGLYILLSQVTDGNKHPCSCLFQENS